MGDLWRESVEEVNAILRKENCFYDAFIGKVIELIAALIDCFFGCRTKR